jgi:superkiller protein 3
VWFGDDELVESPLAVERAAPGERGRTAAHPALGRAMALCAEGRREAALAELAAAAEVPETRADALLFAAQIQFEQGRYEEAAFRYQALAESAPEHRAAWFNRGVCLARLARWRDAVKCFQQAALTTPDRAAAWFGLGVSLLHERRAAEARAAFEQSLKLRPEHVPSLAGEAAALQMTGDPGPALTIYRRLLAERPEVPELLENALSAAVELDDTALVRGWADRLLAIDPDSRPALVALALTAIRQRDNEAAARYHRALGGGCWEVSFQLGLLYQEQERWAEAAELYAQTLREKPDCVEAFLNLGHVYRALGLDGPSRECWRQAVELRPELARRYFGET